MNTVKKILFCFIISVVCFNCHNGSRKTAAADYQLSDNEIIRRIVFPAKEASPERLRIDGSGSTLYFLESGVRKMSVTDNEIPSTTLIDGYFYNLGINPVNGDIFVTDTIDFQQRGRLMIFDNNGALLSNMLAGIIPSKLYFDVLGK